MGETSEAQVRGVEHVFDAPVSFCSEGRGSRKDLTKVKRLARPCFLLHDESEISKRLRSFEREQRGFSDLRVEPRMGTRASPFSVHDFLKEPDDNKSTEDINARRSSSPCSISNLFLPAGTSTTRTRPLPP